MYDPLEQFNIIQVFSCLPCRYYCPVWDNVSIVGFFTISLFFVLIYFLNTFSMKGAIFWECFIAALVSELKSVLQSNMIFKKQIFLSYLITLFFFILFSNIFGMIPYNVTVTSYFVLSFFFSAITFISVTLVGIRYHGTNFIKVLLPEGVPFMIALILIPIELISYFSRVLSLSIRLFANMLSGHTLLKILLGFSWVIMTSSYAMVFFGAFPLLVVTSVTFLEHIIAFLQAYIFIVLSSIYFNDVINLH